MLFFNRFTKSFLYAIHGLSYTWRHEPNFRIQLVAAFLVIIAGLSFSISRSEWLIIFLVISSVLVLELLNSAVETLTDLVKPRLHEYVRLIKDMMASAVLVASVAAIVIGLAIFIPYL